MKQMDDPEPASAPSPFPDFLPAGRDYARLLVAYTKVIDALEDDASAHEAMQQSFDDVVAGFGADKALVVIPRSGELEIL